MMGKKFQKAAGIVVIRRINYFSDNKFASKDILPAVSMDHAEILKCYNGIEGDPWPIENEFTERELFHGLVSLNQLDNALSYYQKVAMKYSCDLLFILVGTTLIETERIPKNFVFCGFDYGIYDSEFNCYSAIFNEVIYGRYKELRAFGRKLNNSLLFDTPDLIAKFHKVRNDLIIEGADLETSEGDDEEFFSINVYRMI